MTFIDFDIPTYSLIFWKCFYYSLICIIPILKSVHHLWFHTQFLVDSDVTSQNEQRIPKINVRKGKLKVVILMGITSHSYNEYTQLMDLHSLPSGFGEMLYHRRRSHI